MLYAIIISSLAGIIGTGMGGVLGLFFGNSSDRSLSYILSFAAGIMLSIVYFELIPGSIALTNVYITIISTVAGVIIIKYLNAFVDKFTKSSDAHINPEEMHHQEGLINATSSSALFKAGVVMFTAIALHNLPEGMVIGAGAVHDQDVGIVLAMLIALHDIPEGMAVAIPLIAGKMSRGKSLFWTAVAGVPTLIGGILGAALGGLNSTVLAVSLSLAGGAMLYVAYGEMMPQVILLNRGRRSVIYTIAGILFGLFFVNVLS